MDNLDLLLKLVRAEDEEAVSKIISNHPILKKDENWKPLAGEHSNIGLAHAQQASPIPALIEKPVNSIDALLTKECILKGIDPEGQNAPSSIQEAGENFFGIERGNFTEITEKRLREIAENIQIIAEGTRQNPNIIIYDNGEGQHPSDFEKTFLYRSRENKIKIKFVQGKFNMGGTGALCFCGSNKYQLILSRRHLSLLNGKQDFYGFTLVRLHQVWSIGEYKTPWYEYCIDKNGEIFSFSAKELDLGLFRRKFQTGTYIKLFNYDLPDRSDITLGLWRALNRYLYYPALPVLLYEKRNYRGHAETKLMLGNKMRVMKDEREQKETSFPLEINFKGLKFPGEVTVFKDEVDKNEFVEKLAVIFTINGQVHDYLSSSFIASKNGANLPYLSGSLLVNIDCSNISPSAHYDLFMSSRDRRRDTEMKRELDDEIAKELRDLDILRQLNEKRRDEKIFKNPKDENFLKRVMGRLIRKNEEISKLLGLNGEIASNIIKKTLERRIKKEGSIFKPKRYPSFVRFKKIAPGNIKMLPQNGECKLFLETDVEDEYLIRPRDQGELKITFEKPHLGGGGEKEDKEGSDEDVFDVNVVGPTQGEIKLRIKTKKELPVGTTVTVNIELSSPGGPHTLTAFVKIDNPIKEAKEEEIESRLTYRLPEIIEIYREKKEDRDTPTWNDKDYNWCGEDICKIWQSSDEKSLVDAVAINMDADALHDYIRKRKLTDRQIENTTRLYRIGVYLISLIIYFQISHREDIENKEELVSYLMKGVGKIIIHVVINEEIIKEIEKEEI
ncbi:MAG: hypothetical protein FJZ16_00075 [Candidatus Omnitrophica bacterium]|nr:hypothetical protein [Candidatus Omnitrophota bacterium]